jgi:hypothetical protein
LTNAVTEGSAAVDRPSQRLFGAGLVLWLALALAACGSEDPAEPIEPPPATLAEILGPWRPVPLRLAPETWAAIETACRQDIQLPAGSHALHIDARGAGVVTVRMTGAGSGGCDALQVVPGGQVVGAGSGWSTGAEQLRIPAGTTLGPVEESNVNGGDLKVFGWSVHGPVGAEIATVIVQPPGQPQVVATVMNGWFSAWWPAQAPPNQALGNGPLPPTVTIQGLDQFGQVVNQLN